MTRLLNSATTQDESYPLSLVSQRELRSQNTWLHNVAKLVVADRVQHLRIHPDDAEKYGIADGDLVEISSRHGQILVPSALVTDEMMPGTLALPHGWGHEGGWQRAVAMGGGGYTTS